MNYVIVDQLYCVCYVTVCVCINCCVCKLIETVCGALMNVCVGFHVSVCVCVHARRKMFISLPSKNYTESGRRIQPCPPAAAQLLGG